MYICFVVFGFQAGGNIYILRNVLCVNYKIYSNFLLDDLRKQCHQLIELWTFSVQC